MRQQGRDICQTAHRSCPDAVKAEGRAAAWCPLLIIFLEPWLPPPSGKKPGPQDQEGDAAGDPMHATGPPTTKAGISHLQAPRAGLHPLLPPPDPAQPPPALRLIHLQHYTWRNRLREAESKQLSFGTRSNPHFWPSAWALGCSPSRDPHLQAWPGDHPDLLCPGACSPGVVSPCGPKPGTALGLCWRRHRLGLPGRQALGATGLGTAPGPGYKKPPAPVCASDYAEIQTPKF